MNLDKILLDLEKTKALIDISPDLDTKLSNSWETLLVKSQTDAEEIKDNFSILRNAVDTCSVSQGKDVRLMIEPLSVALNLNEGYLEFVSDTLKADQFASDGFAKLRIVSLRMDALTQLAGEWLTQSPLSGCGLPHVQMLEVVDPKKTCIKASHGDEAGTLGGPVSGTAGSTPCATIGLPPLSIPMPTP
ncbi:MAG: hypothetical protein KA715_08780 [Xanthomonadaceae bacterium]|nr:hypothetical protein [Xanthomonadaceae bacterium]